MLSTGGGEKGEACGACVGTAADAGTAVDVEGVEKGLAPASPPGWPCLMGTCIGAEPRPICTEGADEGIPGESARGSDPGAAAGDET